jgi:hypothetical protein
VSEIDRSAARRAKDEQIAAEAPLTSPDLPADTPTAPMETYLGREKTVRPVAVAGVVENGLVRPLDPAVKLAERSRVIIVAAGG